MKKADKPSVVIHIHGDNNKVILGEARSSLFAIVIRLILITVAVLIVSHCCPDLLASFVRWIIGTIINS